MIPVPARSSQSHAQARPQVQPLDLKERGSTAGPRPIVGYPLQGRVSDPDRADEERDGLGARAVGRGEGASRPLPDDALKIVIHGADKEDKIAA
jgi:hypothetical protein